MRRRQCKAGKQSNVRCHARWCGAVLQVGKLHHSFPSTAELRPRQQPVLALVCTMCSSGSPLRFSAASATTEAGENSMNSASSLQGKAVEPINGGVVASPPDRGQPNAQHGVPQSTRSMCAWLSQQLYAPVHQGAVHQALLHDGDQVLAHVLDDGALLGAVHAGHQVGQVGGGACAAMTIQSSRNSEGQCNKSSAAWCFTQQGRQARSAA